MIGIIEEIDETLGIEEIVVKTIVTRMIDVVVIGIITTRNEEEEIAGVHRNHAAEVTVEAQAVIDQGENVIRDVEMIKDTENHDQETLKGEGMRGRTERNLTVPLVVEAAHSIADESDYSINSLISFNLHLTSYI